MHPVVVARQRAIRQVRQKWVAEQLAATRSTDFNPGDYKADGDYNLHHIDMETSADALEDLQRRIDAAIAQVDAEYGLAPKRPDA